MNNKVSVIVPAYNCSRFISDSVKSLLNQTYKNFEIIIVNDGSTDNTEKIIKDLQKDNPSVIYIYQENKGVSEARNRGIKEASGKYIVFMDSDDEVDSHWIERLVYDISTNNTEIAVCGYYVKHRDTQKIDSKNTFSKCITERNEFIDRIFIHRDILPAIWNKIFLTDIIREYNIQFDKRYTVGEDLLFLVKYCLHINKAYIDSEPLYIYYINSSGAMQAHNTNKDFKESWLTEWYSVNTAEKLLQENKIKSDSLKVKKARIADKLISVIEKYNYQTNVKQEMLSFLRKNCLKVIMKKEFGVKKKLSILLNCLSPKIKKKVNKF